MNQGLCEVPVSIYPSASSKPPNTMHEEEARRARRDKNCKKATFAIFVPSCFLFSAKESVK
jgi:hypothetical protein